MKERIVHSHARIFLLCLADIAVGMHIAERGTRACVSMRVSVLHKTKESVHGFLIHSAHHARWRRPACPTSLEHNNIDMTPLYYCLRHERETNVRQMNFDCESLTLCSAMSIAVVVFVAVAAAVWLIRTGLHAMDFLVSKHCVCAFDVKKIFDRKKKAIESTFYGCIWNSFFSSFAKLISFANSTAINSPQMKYTAPNGRIDSEGKNMAQNELSMRITAPFSRCPCSF